MWTKCSFTSHLPPKQLYYDYFGHWKTIICQYISWLDYFCIVCSSASQRRKSAINTLWSAALSAQVFSGLFLGCLHTVTLKRQYRRDYLTVTCFLNSTSLNKPTISFVLIGALVHGFIVFQQNGRKRYVSVMFPRCYRRNKQMRYHWDLFPLGQNTWISLRLYDQLCCETCRILQRKVFYPDTWVCKRISKATVGWRILMIVYSGL